LSRRPFSARKAQPGLHARPRKTKSQVKTLLDLHRVIAADVIGALGAISA
jgi:hypothetical protein